MGNRVAQLKGQAESPRDKRRSGSWGGSSNKSSASSSPSSTRSFDDTASPKRDKKLKLRASLKIQKSFVKYVEKPEDDPVIDIEKLISDMTSFDTKKDEERLIIQLILIWQLLGGGKEALQNINKMRDSVPAQEFFDIIRGKGLNNYEQLEQYLVNIVKAVRGGNDSTYLFEDLYIFCFAFGKSDGAKVIERDVAIMLWKALFGTRFPLLRVWCNFLEEKHNKGISLDTWSVFLEFVNVLNSPDEYQADSSWPTLIDEFVEYVHTSKNSLRIVSLRVLATSILQNKISGEKLNKLSDPMKQIVLQYAKLLRGSQLVVS